jgi:glycosyltransferase involved in cell wall biosynthesis
MEIETVALSPSAGAGTLLDGLEGELRAGEEAVVCFGHFPDLEDVEALLSSPRVASMLAPALPDGVDESRAVAWAPGARIRWPARSSEVLALLGPAVTPSLSLLRHARANGVRVVLARYAGAWTRVGIGRAIVRRTWTASFEVVLRRSLRWLYARGQTFSPAHRLAVAMNGHLDLSILAAAPGTNGAEIKKIMLYSGGLGAGGAERQFVNTAVALAGRGFDVVCAFPAAPEGFYREHLDAASVRLLDARVRSEPSAWRAAGREVEKLQGLPADVALDVVDLACVLRREEPDVLHCWQDHTNVVGLIAGKLAGVPRIVLSGRSLPSYEFGFFQILHRPAYAATAELPGVRVLNNSAAGASGYERWAGLSSGSVRVVRNGVYLAGLRKPTHARIAAVKLELGIPPEAPVVGTVSTLYSVKRPFLWLRAAGVVAHRLPSAHFVIVGDGPLRGRMEAWTRRRGLAGRIHFLGRRSDIAEPLGLMDVFLLTSRIEGLPNVLLEAQWLSLPVVTTAVGGASEALEEGVTGHAVASAAPKALARAILAFLTDPVKRKRANARAPEFVSDQFSIERMIAETIETYRSIDECGVVARAAMHTLESTRRSC